jgi:hypothetical protein
LDIESHLIEDLNGEDELGCVLRGHIHIENRLDEFLLNAVENKKYIKYSKLDYFQKVSMTLALGLPEWLATPLKYIGNLRNEFAHNLNRKLGKQEVENFYKSFPGKEKDHIQKVIGKVSRNTLGKKVTLKRMSLKEQFNIYVITIEATLHVINTPKKSRPNSEFSK